MLQRMEKRRESSSRSDDNLSTFVKRLETFHAKNQPIIDYYDKQKKLCKVILSSCAGTHTRYG